MSAFKMKDRPLALMPPLRVRLLVDSSGLGGIERHIAVLARALRQRDIDARVWLYADHGPNLWLEQLAAADVPVEIIRGGARGLLRALRAAPGALLHTHGYKAGVIGRLAARLAGAPVVSTFHAGETGAFPVNLYQVADEWSACLAPRISVSAKIAERLPFASRVVANFIETPEIAPNGPLPDVVAFVGRLSHEKGPDLFCEAAAQSPAGLSWRFYGDGPMRAALEIDHAGDVEFKGMVADIDRIWPQIGLLVMPSRAEGLPMAALEALAAGIPVAAARVGALPELIRPGVNGWLFEPGDVGALQKIVAEWAGGRAGQGAAWRQAAWSSVKENYGVETGVDAILECYADAGIRAGIAR